jgi:hypothetical protein
MSMSRVMTLGCLGFLTLVGLTDRAPAGVNGKDYEVVVYDGGVSFFYPTVFHFEDDGGSPYRGPFEEELSGSTGTWTQTPIGIWSCRFGDAGVHFIGVVIGTDLYAIGSDDARNSYLVTPVPEFRPTAAPASLRKSHPTEPMRAPQSP